MIKINIAKEYSETPGGRYIKEGPNSGEDFRNKMLVPAMDQVKNGKENTIEINLDGCYGFPSSFLSEAFGGLSKIYGNKLVQKTLQFICEDQPRLESIIREEYIQQDAEE